MNLSHLLAAIAGIDHLKKQPPDSATIANFKEQCRQADLSLLGHLLMTAGHPVLERVAADEINRRLSEATKP